MRFRSLTASFFTSGVFTFVRRLGRGVVLLRARFVSSWIVGGRRVRKARSYLATSTSELVQTNANVIDQESAILAARDGRRHDFIEDTGNTFGGQERAIGEGSGFRSGCCSGDWNSCRGCYRLGLLNRGCAHERDDGSSC